MRSNLDSKRRPDMSSQHFKSWVALYLNTDLIPKAEKHQMGMKLKSA